MDAAVGGKDERESWFVCVCGPSAGDVVMKEERGQHERHAATWSLWPP